MEVDSRSPAEEVPCLLPWVGGKFNISEWIISHFPPHRAYIEVFGGMANVLLAKPPSEVTILNDIDGDLVNLLFTVRDYSQELQRLLEYIPYSRQVFESWKRERKLGIKGASPLEQAARYFYLCSAAFSSKLSGAPSFRAGIESNVALAHFNRIDGIPIVARRLRGVVVEHMDYESLLKKYDPGPDALCYFDPPYIIKRREAYYAGSGMWLPEDHARLAQIVKGLRCNVALSYYPDPLLDELYPEAEGWQRAYLEVRTSAANVKAKQGETRDKRTEMLIMNYTWGQQAMRIDE